MMSSTTRLDDVLARQKKGLLLDTLAIITIAIVVALAAVGLWMRLPSLASAYPEKQPVIEEITPATMTATMLDHEEACGAVELSC